MVLTESNDQLAHGDTAPAFELKGTDNQQHSIANFPEAKAYLIVFMCNHCPYVHAQFKELNAIHEKFKDRGLIVIGINANESENYPEDSFENMQKLSQNRTINYLYLHDKTQETAKAYGAVCTPDPFLFDANKQLIFHAKIPIMGEAISEFLETGKITKPEERSIGCSIKWK